MTSSGISTFCGKDGEAKARAVFDMYRNEENAICEEDTQKFLTAVFKVRRPQVADFSFRTGRYGSSVIKHDTMRYLHDTLLTTRMLHCVICTPLNHDAPFYRPLTCFLLIFRSAPFQVLLEVGNSSTMEHVDPQHLAKTTAAYAFRSAALRPDGSMGPEEFHRWHSR